MNVIDGDEVMCECFVVGGSGVSVSSCISGERLIG